MATIITHDDLHSLTSKLSKARSLDEIEQQCITFCQLTEFDYFSYCATIPTTLTRPDMIEINSYPEAWRALYQDKELIKKDPTLIYAETNHTPITWDKMIPQQLDDKNSRMYIRKAKKHGLKSGISFPLRGNVGSTAVLSLVSKKNAPLPQALVNTTLTFGSLFATYVHDAVLRIFDEDLLPIKKKRISLRERECLLWVAEGKTTWEIAQILKIANRTVVYHLERIILKLEVKNRQQAVARGMMMSYISHRLDWEPSSHHKKPSPGNTS
ncbi:MAG: LuxR family transcriptional regulator [Gammaproteobacteria bacterium]|nr:LuxR family transcriptional regulator [Gammaproteobacteria bacterium]